MVSRAALSLSLDQATFATRILKSFQQQWEETPLLTGADVFIASFCEDSGNELSQWRGYGAFGSGYSIGFRSLPQGEALLKVRYVDPNNIDGEIVQRIQYFVARAAVLIGDDEDPDLVNQAVHHLYFSLGFHTLRMKNAAFRAEQEWRLVDLKDTGVQYRATERGLIPYINIPVTADEGQALIDLERVYVGPSNHSSAAVGSVVGFLTARGYDDAASLVRPSGIPFRG